MRPVYALSGGVSKFAKARPDRTFQAIVKEAYDYAIADIGLDFPAFTGAVDGSVASYFSEHFGIEVGGNVLAGRIVGSGEDALDREPVWWYAIQFEAAEPVRSFRVRNTLLLELFDDQRNIVKFVHFPDGTQKTYSFGRGEEVFDVEF